ncbi:Arsenite/antimonite efflux pump membrane protein, ArsB [Syntrophomonas zehnderi OL-4]|uniref:Arsenite/antimonite efflux pump membrane protein, ArsB n=1 Tax=Syntrophomonas zehnderi OL-4 TaxID=690567 RepID=A0A0E4GAH6_9FIRM|nr:ArsB/NhaD family transporter [Syntrophomonas zehnderi]CFX48045.1 Arsenite/antimonite efflux pump membrane protein, ArsB [Syntrophomonas zehnderi OL-4]
MFYFWLSIAIFLITYVFIIWEKIHRSVVAFVAGTLVIALGVISQEMAVEAVDFNTLWLLIAMMIIVGITRKSGVFEYLAIKSAKVARGNPMLILVLFSVITAVASALLDNVTTVLLMVPVTYAITDRLGINPIPFLLAEILSSNIGGTATLIGDPPNIMIGSATKLGFMDFVSNLALPVIVILIVTIIILMFIFKKSLHADEDKIEQVMELDEYDSIKDWGLLKKSLLVLALTMLGFILHQSLNLESATVALLGAGILMLITGVDPAEALLNVEWPTIVFFAGLFIIVGGMEANGVIEYIAQKTLDLTGGSEIKTGMFVLWLSAIASAFLDNIPFTATMIPLLQSVGEMSHMPMESIWWALSLGACLGGNGTLVGASANVIVAGIAERNGTPISFIDYLKIGFPLMILSVVMAMGYLYIAFWM